MYDVLAPRNERRIDPQIVVGLLVDRTGFPLQAGMFSASKVLACDEAGLGFIVGSRMTEAAGDLESDFYWNGEVFTDGQMIGTVTPRHADSTVDDVAHRAEPVWNPDDRSDAWRAIWACSATRAQRDAGE